MSEDANDDVMEQLRRIDTSVAHPARVYDYWLGGKDNYAADRETGDQILKVMPELAVIARAEREFLARVVRHLVVEADVRQFLDIGTGIPSADNTHEVAQAAAPDARIVYVDNDPIVLAHARALLRGTPEGSTMYIDADLRDPATILRQAAESLDFTRPVGLMLLGVLEFVPDDEQAYAVVAELMEALPSGSHLTVASSVSTPDMDRAAAIWNDSGATPITIRTPEQLMGFYKGMDLVEPGMVSLPKWRPEPTTQYAGQEVSQYGAVGRKS
ncbi:SAM-dependent methyltransferase [Nonomuraea guangzhouensis]|uniref:SAM-dependent methyltransferase n=1 Tax=Nonomuraea guangzhouensis TaxID=1291555 RepID=A0ABW4GCZ7_9ACTN|nr:SAM-dependent methyltransferase [Nonomuraea guangzhouensis]